MPHLLAGGNNVYLGCRADVPDPMWDGTWTSSVSPADIEPSPLLLIEAKWCHDLRFGGPNDEALHGHPLSGRGLDGYGVSEVHNSEWIAHVTRVNSVHPHHRDGAFSTLRHFVLPFHDEMVEILARSLELTVVTGTIRGVLVDLAERMTS